MKKFAFLLFFLPLLGVFWFLPPLASAQESNDSLEVMKQFNEQSNADAARLDLSDSEKYQIMFFMGVPLIVLLLITVALGVAMAVFGKPVFIAHMIFAGLSLTLALAHAVAGVVWFYPF